MLNSDLVTYEQAGKKISNKVILKHAYGGYFNQWFLLYIFVLKTQTQT